MKTVLIVDDSITVLEMLDEKISNRLNVNILKAETYKDAVKHILQNKNIHVAILDLNLPDVKRGDIVDFAIGKHISSIVLTGEVDPDVKKEILKKDIIDYIIKDDINSTKQLLNILERTLNNYNTNVLLVDDSALQLSVALKFLNDMKIDVTTAEDGLKAFDILENSDKNFSLVLTDYNMPNMDGMELTTKIREKYQKDKLGIIVLSANDTPDISAEFIKIGANDFINKPYTQIEFKTRVNSNLELLELFEKTRDLANKDFLTGSYNRRYFFEAGGAIYLKNQRGKKDIAVAMFDIDKFKNINDTYGHDVGDVAIQEIARILDDNLRTSDLVARFGGEEFCVLLEEISLEDVELLFEKIRAAFESNILKVGEIEIKYTVSVGVCYGMEDDLEDMIKKSDEGLYYCKNNGRNQVAINK
ncbi:MAG: diguanylate cyclase [Campylobacterota bacterium]|nr:diguanylate cyclase [Campylobacterota bacterium]